MTPADARRWISKLVERLAVGARAIDMNPAVLSSAGNTTWVTWANTPNPLTNLLGSEMTFDGYIALLQSRAFSAVLCDGSMIQMSYTFVDGILVKHRLCYLPCPLEVASEDIAQFGLVEILQAQSNLSSYLQLRGPVRFDFDLASASRAHPAVHFTAGATNCRIPVDRPMSVGEFGLFIVSNYYQDWLSGLRSDLLSMVHVHDDELAQDHAIGLHVRSIRRSAF